MTARQLRLCLERLGVSQRRLAKVIGVNERTMRMYIAGRRIPGPTSRLIRLAADGLVTLESIEEAGKPIRGL